MADVDSLNMLTSRIDSLSAVVNARVPWTEILIVILALVAVIGFLAFALHARKSVFEMAEDKDRMAEFAMKQTFGLPEGTVRGVMAILVALVFLGSVFIYGEDMPETVKIITSLVFGYYFAKSSSQAKDVMDAMLGKTSQKAVRKQEAMLAVSEARGGGADSYAAEELAEAERLVSGGDQKRSSTEAIELYQKAIEKAQAAHEKTSEAKARVAQEEEAEQQLRDEKDQSQFATASRKTRTRIDELIAFDIDHRGILGIWETAGEQALAKNYASANQTLMRVENMVDVLLKEYDEAKEIYEKKLQEDQRQALQNAKEVLDSDDSLIEVNADGKRIIEALFLAQGYVKDHNPDLLPLLRKRVMGEQFERSDLLKIFTILKEEGQIKILNNVIDVAANSVGALLPQKFREDLTVLDLYEKLVLGESNELAGLFREYFSGHMAEDDFTKFAQKVRKNLVDGQIGDRVKAALSNATDFDFDRYKKALKRIQDDQGGRGALVSVGKILDVGETVLSYTPLGGAAKTAATIGRGLFKIFG